MFQRMSWGCLFQVAFVASLGFNLGACGDKSKYERACGPGPTEEQTARMKELTQENQDARLKAVDAIRASSGYSPLTAALILDDSLSTFPYPEAILVSDPAKPRIDLKKSIASFATHDEEALQIFETSPGSGEFFLIDRIGGDGAGSSTANAIGSVEHYHLAYAPDKQPSWHNWHFNRANELARLHLTVTTEIEQELFVCGCGAAARVVAGVADMAMPSYGLFKIPGSVLPRAGSIALKAEYQQRRFVINYVPPKGKKCQIIETVC